MDLALSKCSAEPRHALQLPYGYGCYSNSSEYCSTLYIYIYIYIAVYCLRYANICSKYSAPQEVFSTLYAIFYIFLAIVLINIIYNWRKQQIFERAKSPTHYLWAFYICIFFICFFRFFYYLDWIFPLSKSLTCAPLYSPNT